LNVIRDSVNKQGFYFKIQAVFLELVRKTNKKPLMEIYYWKNYQHEVDFVIKKDFRV
jgi:hypothetical protein